MTSPTQRTLKKLRDEGYRAEVVEKWIPQARRRKDLFGFIDVLAVGHGKTVGVQSTTSAHLAERVAKCSASEALSDVHDSGWVILCHGWRKNSKNRWVCKEVLVGSPVAGSDCTT